jgi:hypothetical protein
MPYLRFKNFSNHSFFASPKSSIGTQDFAPQIAAQIAITRISMRSCFLFYQFLDHLVMRENRSEIQGRLGVGQFFSSILQLKKMMKGIAIIFELAFARGRK